MALQIRRGTNRERLDFTPVEGEIVYVTDSQLSTVVVTTIDGTAELMTSAVPHGLTAGQQVKFISNTANGLTENAVYYVIASGLTSGDFKVSTTLNGTAVNLTTGSGLGLQFAVGPTDAAGVPVGYSVAPCWLGDGITTGGLAAGASTLDELSDVSIGVSGLDGVALDNNHMLQYNTTRNQWENRANIIVPGSLNVYGNTTLRGAMTTIGDQTSDQLILTGPNVYAPNNLAINGPSANHIFVEYATGNVGIGDGTPVYKLDVAGSMRATGNIIANGSLTVDGNTTLGNAVGDTVTINAGSITAPNNLSIDSDTLFVDTVNNRVGILKNNPSVALDINGDIYVGGASTLNGNVQVNGNTTLGNSSGDTTTLNGYNLYIPNSLAIDTDLVIIDSTQNRIGFGGAVDAAYRVNVNGGIQTSGDVNINGGDLRSDATTFNLLPANSSTINIGPAGSATNVKNLNIANTTTASGLVYITNTIDSTNPDSGALQVDGGVGINKHLHVGGSISVDNADAAINPTTGSIQTDGGLGVVGTAWIGGDLRVDATTAATSTTTGAIQTDGGLGVVGDAYVGGNANVDGSLTVTGNLTVNGTTTTVNSTTLTVDDKNIELGSVATPSDTTANGGGITLKGTTDKTITWNSTTGRWETNVGLNTPGSKIGNVHIANGDDDNQISTSTGALEITSATGVVDFVAGQIDTSATTGQLFESAQAVYVGGIDTEVIHLGDNDADPKTTIYANGDLQVHDNLTVLGSTTLGNDVELDGTTIQGECEWIGTGGLLTMQVTRDTRRLGVGISNPSEKLHVVGNGLFTGNLTVNGNIYGVDDVVVENGINFNNQVRQDQRTATTTSTAPATLDSIDITQFRTAKYVIQAVAGGEVHAVEVLLTHNGSTAIQTTYGEIYTGSALFSVAADVNSGFARLLVTSASATSTVYRATRVAFNA